MGGQRINGDTNKIGDFKHVSIYQDIMDPKPNKYKRTIRFYGDKNIGRILEAIFYSALVRIKKKLTPLL